MAGSNSTLLILGAVGVAGYFAYKNGMFGNLGVSLPAGGGPAAPSAPAPTTYDMGTGTDKAAFGNVVVTYDKANPDLTYKGKVLSLLAGTPTALIPAWDKVYYIAYGGTPLAITITDPRNLANPTDAVSYINSRFVGGLSGYGMGAFQRYMYKQTGRLRPAVIG